MKHVIITSFCLFLFIVTQAQDPTIGLLYHDAEKASSGYTLISPNGSRNTYLIDNCGRVINQWQNNQGPEIMSYLTEDGSLLRPSWGFIEKRNWEGEQTWLLEMDDFGENHHDIEPLPNGNVLMIVTEFFTVQEATEMGRDPNNVRGEFGIDAIIELQQTGPRSGEVVWKWSFKDHLVQDYDDTKPNYGVIADSPHRINVNYNFENERSRSEDWMHCNGIDYNAVLDQIVISSRHTSEIYIIDHSTTMEEAASSQGGRYGRGGDFLWRWGNPQVYGKGTPADQKLWQQHSPNWIPSDYPDGDKICVFNNKAEFDFVGEESSEINLIDTGVDENGSYSFDQNGGFSPPDFDWTFSSGEIYNLPFYSFVESGVHPLPNGNFLATLGVLGRFVEVTKDQEVVWVYQNPVEGGRVLSQYDRPRRQIDVFKVERFAPDFKGFEGRDMTPGDIIENANPVSDACMLLSSNDEVINQNIRVFPNPVNDILYINTDNEERLSYSLFDANSKLVYSTRTRSQSIDVSFLHNGVYFLIVRNEESGLIYRGRVLVL